MMQQMTKQMSKLSGKRRNGKIREDARRIPRPALLRNSTLVSRRLARSIIDKYAI